MNSKMRLAALILVFGWSATGVAQTVGKQEPDFDASFGWQALHSFDIDETFPWGINFSGSGRITGWMGIAGDVGWNRKATDTFTNGRPTSITDRKLTLALGPRFYFGSGRVSGFAHALVGGATGESFFETTYPDGIFEESEEFSSFLLQPGLGVDIKGSSFFGLRLQLDYQWIAAEKYDDNVRFLVAAVVHFF